MFATFSLAIEKAAADCAEADTLMALLAFFAPDKIPLWLIPDEVLSEKQRDHALAALTSVSLADYDNLPDGTPAVSVHRLVQEVMRGRLRTAGRFEETAALAIRISQPPTTRSDSVASARRNTAWLPQALAAATPAPTSGPAAWHTLMDTAPDRRFPREPWRTRPSAHGVRGRNAHRRAPRARPIPGNAGWQRDLSCLL